MPSFPVVLPTLLHLAWLAAGLVLGLVTAWWVLPGRRARYRAELSALQRSENGLRRDVERLKDVLGELRGKLSDVTTRHSQQLEQLKTIHSAALAHSEEELRRVQSKLLHLIDAMEQGQPMSPQAFQVTQFDEPPPPPPPHG